MRRSSGVGFTTARWIGLDLREVLVGYFGIMALDCFVIFLFRWTVWLVNSGLVGTLFGTWRLNRICCHSKF